MEPKINLNPSAQKAFQGLLRVFFDFERQLGRTSFVKKLNQRTLTLEDYQLLLLNLRAQVIEGSRWISRCASSFDAQHSEVRSMIISHAKDEHRDYELLENDYVRSGGSKDEILNKVKNTGSDALHGFIMYRASRQNPFDLLGAMWIIEGLGQKMANEWAKQIKDVLQPQETITQFFEYHGENDEHHLNRFYKMLDLLCSDEEKADRIERTAKVVAKLYALQIEEIE